VKVSQRPGQEPRAGAGRNGGLAHRWPMGLPGGSHGDRSDVVQGLRRVVDSWNGDASMDRNTMEEILELLWSSPYAVPEAVSRFPAAFSGSEAQELRSFADLVESKGDRESSAIFRHALELGTKISSRFYETDVDEEGVRESISGAHFLSDILRTVEPAEVFRRALGLLFLETQQAIITLRESWNHWFDVAAALRDDATDSRLFEQSLLAIARASAAGPATRSRASFLLAVLGWWLQSSEACAEHLDHSLSSALQGPTHNLTELSGGCVPLVACLIREAKSEEARGVANATTSTLLDFWLPGKAQELMDLDPDPTTPDPVSGIPTNEALAGEIGRAFSMLHWAWRPTAHVKLLPSRIPHEVVILAMLLDQRTSGLWQLGEWLRELGYAEYMDRLTTEN